MYNYRISKRSAQPSLPQPEPPAEPHLSRKERRKQRDERRGWGKDSCNRSQAGLTKRMANLREGAIKVESAQKQVAAREQQLSDERAWLMQISRNKFREAGAAKAEARKATVWANNLIRTELGGSKLSHALALEARLVDTGLVDLPAARRAVAAKDVQDGTDQGSLSVLPTGASVWHFDAEGRPSPATIVSVHCDEAPPYYTVAFDNGHERQTERGKLVCM